MRCRGQDYAEWHRDEVRSTPRKCAGVTVASRVIRHSSAGGIDRQAQRPGSRSLPARRPRPRRNPSGQADRRPAALDMGCPPSSGHRRIAACLVPLRHHRLRAYPCAKVTSFSTDPQGASHGTLTLQSTHFGLSPIQSMGAIVNTPPPEGGGFALRLEAGLVGQLADCRTSCLPSASPLVNVPQRLATDAGPFGRIAGLTATLAAKSLPPKGVGFTDPLSGTLKYRLHHSAIYRLA